MKINPTEDRVELTMEEYRGIKSVLEDLDAYRQMQEGTGNWMTKPRWFNLRTLICDMDQAEAPRPFHVTVVIEAEALDSSQAIAQVQDALGVPAIQGHLKNFTVMNAREKEGEPSHPSDKIAW